MECVPHQFRGYGAHVPHLMRCGRRKDNKISNFLLDYVDWKVYLLKFFGYEIDPVKVWGVSSSRHKCIVLRLRLEVGSKTGNRSI
jgi:hypothetical protein